MASTIKVDQIQSDSGNVSLTGNLSVGQVLTGNLSTSQISIPSPSGTGIVTISSPSTNTDRALTLPDAGGTVVSDTATQTLTNKTIQGGALTLATAVTASGTSVDFTSIPSWVKRITVMFAGVSTNGTALPLIRIGAGSVTTSGYLGTNSILIASALGSANFTTGFVIGVSPGNWAASTVVHGSIVLTLQTGTTWVCFGSVGSSAAANLYITSGSHALGGTLDQVRITTSNGTDTFDAGTINIMYEG
jgi:hypothetical protein